MVIIRQNNCNRPLTIAAQFACPKCISHVHRVTVSHLKVLKQIFDTQRSHTTIFMHTIKFTHEHTYNLIIFKTLVPVTSFSFFCPASKLRPVYTIFFLILLFIILSVSCVRMCRAFVLTLFSSAPPWKWVQGRFELSLIDRYNWMKIIDWKMFSENENFLAIKRWIINVDMRQIRIQNRRFTWNRKIIWLWDVVEDYHWEEKIWQ